MLASEIENQGEKGKRASYTTYPVKIPEPLRKAVDALPANFHSNGTTKATTAPELDESEVLINHYRQLLGKPGVNYWSWKRPEALKVCPELTKLLSLPEPNFKVRAVLEAIAHGENPFQSGKGALSELSSTEKTQWARASIQWMMEQVTPAFPDEKERKQIMAVCYRLNRSMINYILDAAAGGYEKHDRYNAYRNQQQKQRQQYQDYSYTYNACPIVNGKQWYEVLGVSPTATATEVKKARNDKAKKHHSDINHTGDEMMKEVNKAYEIWLQFVLIKVSSNT